MQMTEIHNESRKIIIESQDFYSPHVLSEMTSTDIHFIDCYNLADGLMHKMETHTEYLKFKL